MHLKNIVSLFDGMSCGQIALNEAGFTYDNYFASEVDKYAITVTKANYPNTKHIGSVTEVYVPGEYLVATGKAHRVGKIDLLIGGSPCQNFSFAGSQKGMVTKDDIEILTLEQYLELKNAGFEFQGQSFLFWEYVRILKEIQKTNPNVYFLLENVKMVKKWQDLISSILGVEPILINSALVSAQNRQRNYWTNIPNVTQPEDKGILLKDIIESGEVDRDKSLTVTTRVHGATADRYINKSMHQMVIDKPIETVAISQPANLKELLKRGVIEAEQNLKGESQTLDRAIKNFGEPDKKSNSLTACSYKGVGTNGMTNVLVAKPIKITNVNPSGKGMNGNVYSIQGKSPCLTTNKGEGVKITGGAIRGRYLIDGVRQDGKMLTAGLTTQRLEPRIEGKTNYLTTVQKDNVVVFKPTIERLASNLYFRKLTPLECERLQTVPDNYTAHVSNSQRYKMLGNGWTVDVIAHILSHLKNI